MEKPMEMAAGDTSSSTQDAGSQVCATLTESFAALPFSSEELMHSLEELRRLQEEFVQTLTSEQVTFDEQVTKALYPAAIAFQKIPHYEAKIKKMAKQMQSISQRVAKLKQRATLIQTNAHKQASKKR